ncbi:hypothetical protein CEXT_582531 [Caerostris extrusa]|uniref:Uncharacterized protein n=1 Tax=Caerostris extrusa TaxID=172846 RepID=A0AAV4N5G3_CAEEX|nr:hypothetical protein CEXT_582531 [Caerostris extrusa]
MGNIRKGNNLQNYKARRGELFGRKEHIQFNFEHEMRGNNRILWCNEMRNQFANSEECSQRGGHGRRHGESQQEAEDDEAADIRARRRHRP